MKMGTLTWASAALIIFCGCQSDSAEEENTIRVIAQNDDFFEPAEIEEGEKAFAVINPTSGNEVVGAITFTREAKGVRVIADVGGLTPGKHGFHIHEHGDCSSADGSSAGGHFNPNGMAHGGPDSENRHIGDLGNLEANEFGFAHYDRLDHIIALEGPYSIIGKSVIIHADEDDFTSQPTGNSGARVACGKIVALDN